MKKYLKLKKTEHGYKLKKSRFYSKKQTKKINKLIKQRDYEFNEEFIIFTFKILKEKSSYYKIKFIPYKELKRKIKYFFKMDIGYKTLDIFSGKGTGKSYAQYFKNELFLTEGESAFLNDNIASIHRRMVVRVAGDVHPGMKTSCRINSFEKGLFKEEEKIPHTIENLMRLKRQKAQEIQQKFNTPRHLGFKKEM